MGGMAAESLLHRLPAGLMEWLQAALATPVVLWGGWPFFQRGWTSVVNRRLNMFTLIAMGTGAAYLYSLIATIVPGVFPLSFLGHDGRPEVYFESSAIIVTLVLLGQVLELRARRQTSSAIRALLDLSPKTARRVRPDGSDEDISLGHISKGDRLRVRPGDRGGDVPGEGPLLVRRELAQRPRVDVGRVTAVRAAILSERPIESGDQTIFRPNYDKMYLLGDPPDYEQLPQNALGARALREGKRPEEMAYDAMLDNDGRGMLYVPLFNYADGNLDATYEMLKAPNSVPGLSDGGAHCGIICDASFPTFLLTHWTRDRVRGERLSIPFVVAAQCRRTALSVGLRDRGVIAPGYKADINVIDYDRLRLHPPQVHYDLPMNGRRLMQRIDGYVATIVSGAVTRRDGNATGARPGRLVRGAQSDPR